MDVFKAIAEERRRIADMLETLSPQQWQAQSCCGEWTVQQVVGHMMGGPIKGVRGALPHMVKARFNVDRANTLVANELAAAGPERLVAQLREHAESRFSPPGFGPEAPLTDVIMHGLDIARPLGLTLDVPAAHAGAALKTAVDWRFTPFNSRSKLKGLRFVASDRDFAWGDGPSVEGPSLDLAHAMWGRAAACAALDGPGVEELQRRLRA